MQKALIGAVVLSGALFALVTAAAEKSVTRQGPNVLFILCEDIRWDAPGYAGNP